MKNTSEESLKIKNFKPCQQCGVGTGTSRRLVEREIVVNGGIEYKKVWEWIKHKEPCLYDWNYQVSELGKRIIRTKMVCRSCFLKLASERTKGVPHYNHHKVVVRPDIELNRKYKKRLSDCTTSNAVLDSAK